jgi:catechol 2,3-dioxygenase-like lactoylglutathione lyase family enzyme
MSTIKPTLHHVTIKTSRLDEMIKWYEFVLGAPLCTTIAFDDSSLRWLEIST